MALCVSGDSLAFLQRDGWQKHSEREERSGEAEGANVLAPIIDIFVSYLFFFFFSSYF